MLRALLYSPLLGIAPLVFFLGWYLQGAGVLSEDFGSLVSTAGMFLLPWGIAALISMVQKSKTTIRLWLFLGTLVVQGVVLFTVVPPGATCEMMGFAHRLRREFSVEELRDCAAQIRQKHHEGTLKVSPQNKDDHFIAAQDAMVVSDAELPVSLRGRFKRVFIQKTGSSGEEQVVFALETNSGIICDDRKDVHEFFVYSMADGVQAYRYQRQ